MSQLPNNYTELYYIQSSGTQYIDTGFKMNNKTRIIMKIHPGSQQDNAWLFEGRESYLSKAHGILLWQQSNTLTSVNADYNTYNTRATFSTVSPTDLLYIDYNKNSCTINNETHSWTEQEFTSPVNVYLLANNDNGTVTGQIACNLYYCQIYDDDILIRNFIPCISDTNEIGLYDTINNQFYSNAGTGVFTASKPRIITSTTTYKPSEMAPAVSNLQAADFIGVNVTPETLKINATAYNAEKKLISGSYLNEAEWFKKYATGNFTEEFPKISYIFSNQWGLAGCSTSFVNFYSCTGSLPNWFCYYCLSLETVIGDSITAAGPYGFYTCLKLTDVSLPSLSYLSTGVFRRCETLSTISLPAATTMGSMIFSQCYNLLSVYLMGSTVVSLVKNPSQIFTSSPIDGYTDSTGGVVGSIFVPASLVNAYKTDAGWSWYSNRIVGI